MSESNTTPSLPASPKVHNKFKVTLLGTEGTGKSCFLAGLASIGFDMNDPSITIQANDNETADYLNSLEGSLRKGTWPAPTNITSVLDFTLYREGLSSAMNILTIDYPGEDFRDAFNRMSPERIKRFSEHLLQSDVVIQRWPESLDRKRRGTSYNATVFNSRLTPLNRADKMMTSGEAEASSAEEQLAEE